MEQNSSQLILKNLNFITCPQHQGQIASFCCIDPQYQRSRIVCFLCLEQQNIQQKTKSISLKVALNYLCQLEQNLSKDIIFASWLDMKHYEFSKTIPTASKKLALNKQLAETQLKNLIKMYLCKKKSLINGDHFRQLNKLCDDIQKLSITDRNHLLVKKLGQIVYENMQKFSQLIQGEKNQDYLNVPGKRVYVEMVKNAIKKEIQEKVQQFVKISQKAGGVTLEIVQEIFIQSGSKRYLFSTQLHFGNITIEEDRKTAHIIVDNNESTGMALIEPPLSGNKVRKIKFKINRIYGWLSVGICLRSIVESNSYSFDSYSPGHGAYHFSYDGYLWSNTQPTQNQYYSGHYYNQNDIIEMQYDPLNKKLTFFKNSIQSGQLNIEQTKEKLYFSVAQNYKEDSISILEEN